MKIIRWQAIGLIFIFLSFQLLVALAESSPTSQPASAMEKFEPRVYRNEKKEALPYRLLKPLHYDPRRAYPLLLFLHGAGDGGRDNAHQHQNIASAVAGEEMMRKHPCFVVAPQAPEDAKWVYMQWHDDRGGAAPPLPSRSMRLALELIESLKREFSIDKDRIYVTGYSMGGHGTWDIICRKPNLFAAAVPICGGGDLTKASRLVQVPIWAFHGAKDPIVPVERTRSMIATIRKAGGNPLYTEYPAVDHFAWIPAYQDHKLFDWLFMQRLDRH